MNICPICNSFIHILLMRKMSGKTYIMEEHKKIANNFNEKGEQGKTFFLSHFCCPECDAILFEDDEIEAQKFINKI